MKRFPSLVIGTVWIALMLLALPVQGQRKEGHWVDPVNYFKLKGKGDLKEEALCDYMWETKERFIVGMKCTIYNFTTVADRSGESGLPLQASSNPFYLYIDEPGVIAATSDWTSLPNGTMLGVYRIGATDVTFSFNERTHRYSFFYYPEGTYDFAGTAYLNGEHRQALDEREMGMFYSDKKGLIGYFENAYMQNDDVEDDGEGGVTDVPHKHEFYLQFRIDEVLLDGTDTPLSEAERQSLIDTMDDLTDWLMGKGDPLGLDEHTDAAESAVVGAVGTLLALLLGGLAGGAGGAIPLVPPVSSTVPPAGSTSPVDPTKFNPTDYPDYSDKFITQQPDGDLVVRDPVTGKETLYINNGDGTYRNFNTNQDWTPDEINEQLRSRDENSSLLQQDAETAARNVAEQHTAWEEQNARDLERGYSDEQKEFMDWKQEQEGQLKHEEYLDKMALKYHVPPTDKAIMDAIKFEQIMNQLDYKTHMAEKEAYDKTISYLEKVDKTAEFGVNIMAGAVPGGTGVKNAYTFAKSTLVATNESIVEGKSFGEGVAHIVVGMGNGALGVIQNEAGTLTKDASYGLLIEYGITIGTESAKDGFTKYYETGDIGKAMGAVANAASKKTLEFGASKMISVGLETVKGGAADYVDYAKKGLFPDDDWVFTGACKINNLLNKTADFNMGPEVRGIGGSYTTAIKGTVERGAWVENVINEEVKATGVYDGAGKIGEETLDFFKEIKKFSNKAAQFRKR